MGAKASKPAQTAARRFPTRAPGGAVPPRGPGAAPARRTEPKGLKDEAIRADGRDPDLDLDASTNPAYSERLRQMGVVTPFPTLSNSSTAGPFSPSTHTQTSSSPSATPPKSSSRSPNATTQTSFYPPPSQNRTLNALEARRHLQERAEAEFADPSKGREFLDAGTVRRALLLRDRGVEPAAIEARLKLKNGVVARLGPRGVAVPVQGSSLNKQTWGGLHE